MADLRVVIPVKNIRVDHYIQSLQRQGVEAVEVHDAVDVNTGSYDGLLLPGGTDIDPALYGQTNQGSFHIDQETDALQMKWLDAFVKVKKPVLGICRGHQLINVYFKGTLIQNLPTSNLHAKTRMQDPDLYHLAEVTENSYLKEIYGEKFLVNSSHHQAVDTLGEGLIPQLYSMSDHVEEASRHASLPIWSVQFHPERCLPSYGVADLINGDDLFAFFVQHLY